MASTMPAGSAGGPSTTSPAAAAGPSAAGAKIMIAAFRIPGITAYNRLEVSPRSTDFSRSLRAEVRDALWMLTRQWQFGEFQGEDAGSPVSAMILGEHTPIDRIGYSDGYTYPYDPAIPLEARVEAGVLKPNLFLAVQAARYFIRLMRDKTMPAAYTGLLVTKYPLNYPIDPNDADGQQLLQAVQGTLFDGCALLGDIAPAGGTGNAFTTWVATQAAISGGDQTTLGVLAGNLAAWFTRTYTQPVGTTGNEAWHPSTLDYNFSLGSPMTATPGRPVSTDGAAPAAQLTLTAPHFAGGHLDWYAFDLAHTPLPLKPEPNPEASVVENLVSFIPSPISFKGMPNPRFWMLEDNQTDFGNLDTSPTGLLHLALAEFGLIYGNDWFMLPYPLDTNTVCGIKGMTVLDVFGENAWIAPAGAGTENQWQSWSMFHQTDLANTANPNHLFYLAPAVPLSLQGDPLEEVNFLRDDMAAMAWAIETTVPSQSGKGADGNAMARKTTISPPFIPAGDATIRYVLGTTVPDNWIPFIPVHMEGSNSEIRLQRAAMPGAKGALGEIISETPAPYYIDDQQIPRAGVLVQRGYRRTRWLNGATYLWMSRTRETGKGQGWSNLQFDQIVPIPPAPANS